jgi:hypothetical protein
MRPRLTACLMEAGVGLGVLPAVPGCVAWRGTDVAVLAASRGAIPPIRGVKAQEPKT